MATAPAVPATNADSNESKPMPRGKVPEGVKKWLVRLMLLGAGVIAVICVASIANKPDEQQPSEKAPLSVSRSETPLASSGATVLKLEIPAHRRLEFLPIAGMHPEVTGLGKFSSHAVREEDGTECTSPNCESGPVWKKYYVMNESEVTNTYTVKFKPD